MQPEDLADFGGSLRDVVRARLPEAVALARGELAAWGFAGVPRRAGAAVEPLNAAPLALDAYESERPSAARACRVGDARVLERAALGPRATDDVHRHAACGGHGRRRSRVCEGRGERKRIDVMLVGSSRPGPGCSRSRAPRGARPAADEAVQTNAALDALEAVIAGEANVDAYFADLAGREPVASDHLKGRANDHLRCPSSPAPTPLASADRAALRQARLHRGRRATTSTPFDARAGHTLLLFIEDPVRYKETLDLAVIVPELARAFRGRFAVGVLLPEPRAAIAPRYGFRRWPAFVMLRDGELRRRHRRPAQLGRIPRRGRCAARAPPSRPPDDRHRGQRLTARTSVRCERMP